MKRNHRRQDRFALIVFMVMAIAGMTLIIPPAQVSAKAFITSNVTGTIKLTKGQTTSLYVKNAGKVTWSSSKASVAAVNSSGKVTAKAAGSATVTAKASGKTWKCTVKVSQPAKTITTNVKGTVNLQKGKSTTLYVKNAGKVTWSSAKASVAAVNSSGKVTAKAAGSATITAKASGKTWKCTVKVTAASTKTTKTTTTAQNTGLNTTGMSSADATIFKKIYALHSTYYEGYRWTGSTYHSFKGGLYSGGYGCSGFAFMCSDAAFGSVWARKHTDFSNVKVGDILRINYNSHSVIVLKVVGNNFVVAEGNYDYKVHWGRVIPRSTAKATGTYVMTRR